MQDIVKAAQRGDDQAFYRLISHYKNKIYNTARYYLGSEANALEAVNEVTYRAYVNIRKLKAPENFSGWLGRIMYNYCMDELKRSSRFVSAESMDAVEHEDNISLKLEMNSYISQLRPDFKEVIILRYFDDLSIEEISERLKKPQGTVKTWLSRGLGQLRRIMERT